MRLIHTLSICCYVKLDSYSYYRSCIVKLMELYYWPSARYSNTDNSANSRLPLPEFDKTLK